MTVKWMYFSGRGEAGLHAKTWDMVQLAKERLGTDFLVNTNGNIEFSEKIVHSGLDKIKIAIDGIDQNAYAHYRRGGCLDAVVDFTRKIAELKAASGKTTPRIIWQYILFDHNADEKSLVRLQETAMDIGVDEILFKTTFTDHYASKSLDSVPRIHPDIKFIDIKAMVSTSMYELDENFSRLINCEQKKAWDKLIPFGIEIAKKIFLAFILGIERKQEYNRFGKDDDMAMMLALAEKHSHEYRPILSRLRLCLQMLATAYDNAGNSNDSEFYLRMDRKLDDGGIPMFFLKNRAAA
jgi:hypothetical protein